MSALAAFSVEYTIAKVDDGKLTAEQKQTELTAQLDERAPVYRGMGRAEADQLRGYFLAGFAEVGLPADAFPYVREELEAGDSPYCAAAAAKALSRMNTAAPDWVLPAMHSAVERFLFIDDVIRFVPRASMRGTRTTVLRELFIAFGELGAAAISALPRLEEIAQMKPRPFNAEVAGYLDRTIDRLVAIGAPATCCCGDDAPSSPPLNSESAFRQKTEMDASAIRALRFQDHSGEIANFEEFFDRKINIVAFFYTRCMNPAKCSATIEKLATLQDRLGSLASNCRVAAISYDPEFDTVSRLKTYGSNRKIDIYSPLRLLRCLDRINPLMEYFDLNVGFGDATVIRHRTEIFMLDANSTIVESILRRQWTVEEALSWIDVTVT